MHKFSQNNFQKQAFAFSSIELETKKPPFTFVKQQQHVYQPSDLGASCFFVELQRVTFKRQLNIFELSFHLPQFSCYDVILKTQSDIKIFLNLNDFEWDTLTNNLFTVGDYQFEKQGTSSRPTSAGYESSIKKQLDIYFSTLSPFKTFQLFSDGHDFSCQTLSRSALQENITNAVDPSILDLILLRKN
jgi:hypothetical protein